MASVLLINAVDLPQLASSLAPDSGLASLAAVLLSHGHRVRIWDPASTKMLRAVLPLDASARAAELMGLARHGPLPDAEAAERLVLDQRIARGVQQFYRDAEPMLSSLIERQQVDLLGLKLWAGAGSGAGLDLAARLARGCPGLKVVAGGPLAIMAPELLLHDHGVLDAVCIGDGEPAVAALGRLCDGRCSWDRVPNLVRRDGPGVVRNEPQTTALEQLPTPCYDPEVYPDALGPHRFPLISLDDSRGCPGRCAFCAHASMSGARRRTLPAARVAELMQTLGRRTGVRAFRLSGSNTPYRLYRDLAEELLARELSVSYAGFAHPGAFPSDDLAPLVRSGLVALFFGLESASSELLAGPLGKTLDPKRAAQTLTACMDAGIFCAAGLIFPAPGETEQTEQQTERLVRGLLSGERPGSVPLQPAVPQPGSKWWNNLKIFGFSGKESDILCHLCHRPSHYLFPTDLIRPLPYALDGRPYPELYLRCLELARRLEHHGILTGVGDDTALLAHAAGLEVRDFRRTMHDALMAVDAPGAEAVIDRCWQRA